ncbi:MAG TPA: helix-turn-helix transcriptional regulator [Acidimicrobiales bacterium]|nr:helix-turn-helix transcriptional regulator [Acidimicrobiales bacterium]
MARQPREFDRLTPREQEVLSALMRGDTARDICKHSFVAMPTVRSQIRSILTKLGVSSQLAAVVLAYRSGWPGVMGVERDGPLIAHASERASA